MIIGLSDYLFNRSEIGFKDFEQKYLIKNEYYHE